MRTFAKNRTAALRMRLRLGLVICCFAEAMSTNRAAVMTPPLIRPRGGNVEALSHKSFPIEGDQGGVASSHALFVNSYSPSRHPFYVSICQIDHNAKTKSLEITFKIFTEDLETALEAQTTERLRLGSDRESAKADHYILNYLKSHLTLQVDEDTVTFKYLGKEIEMDETWCYVEVPNVPSVNKLTVRNSLLMENFEAQQNIVHVKVGGKQKSLVLWKDKREGSVEF